MSKEDLQVSLSSADRPDLLNLRTLLKLGNQPRRANAPMCLFSGEVNLRVDDEGFRNHPLLATEPFWL